MTRTRLSASVAAARVSGQRPVIEIMPDNNDPCLSQVRATITLRQEGPDIFCDSLFQLIFGNRR